MVAQFSAQSRGYLGCITFLKWIQIFFGNYFFIAKNDYFCNNFPKNGEESVSYYIGHAEKDQNIPFAP
jgi:hypothetical protein